MAAYASLVSLSQLIDQILSQDLDYAFLCDKEQMKSLYDKVIRLQEFLEHNSVRFRSSIPLDELESRIRNVASKLDSIMDSIICNLLPHPPKTSSYLLSAISCIRGKKGEAKARSLFFSCTAKIDIILHEATSKKYVSAANSTTSSSRAAPTAQVINMVGLDDACTQMLNTITGHTASLQIIPITGMGGIGKTTLASAVYNHSRSLHHFDVRLWVTISQDYDLQQVFRGLLSTVKQNEQPDGSLLERVYKYLKGRRFLIVLDDMWHEKAWDGIRNAFPDDENRSRIILTTRESGVALYVGSLSYVHKMQLLNEDQSWIMLRQKVYGEEEPCPAELDDIGRTIARNCKGLPLAIVVIAGVLKRNKRKVYWEEVAENTNAVAATDYDKLLGILSLSYINLSPQLKACFLYFVTFPEDYEFRAKELAMLWTAEGFLKPRESKTMEDIAEECIQELGERSLLLVKKKTYNGKIKTFSIHDVLREVSIKKANEEKFLQQNSTFTVQHITKDQRKVRFLKNDLNFFSSNYRARPRSFKFTFSRPATSLRDLSVLSVLCNTTSLRYLCVSHEKFHKETTTFPKSISELQNLETFVINHIPLYDWLFRKILPLDIWKLPRLRHIFIQGKCTLEIPVANERGYPILESLQTLVGVWNLDLSMDFIQRIPNVKRMKLMYDLESFSFSNLQHLHQLEVLSIWCQFRIYHQPSASSFPQNLKKLSLCGIKVPSMTIIGSLQYLEFLKLKKLIIGQEIWEPAEEEFLQLKYLKMEGLDIEEWRVESFNFPCLQKLVIIRCWILEEIPQCVGEIDTLEELVLVNCGRRIRESVEKIQEKQQAFGNDSLKITILDRRARRSGAAVEENELEGGGQEFNSRWKSVVRNSIITM